MPSAVRRLRSWCCKDFRSFFGFGCGVPDFFWARAAYLQFVTPFVICGDLRGWEHSVCVAEGYLPQLAPVGLRNNPPADSGLYLMRDFGSAAPLVSEKEVRSDDES